MTRCVIWPGGTMALGYGRLGRNTYAHRHVWEQRFGAIPAGHVLHHTCGNRRCVNLAHLELTTQARHIRLHEPERDRWGRQT